MIPIFSGHPIPDLTWWLGGNMIDSQYYLAHKDTVINDLENFKVLRHMDGALIECKANNTHVSNPTIRSLVLDMHCKIFFPFFLGILLTLQCCIFFIYLIYFLIFLNETFESKNSSSRPKRNPRSGSLCTFCW